MTNERIEQVTRMYLNALKGIEQGHYDDCVFIPYNKETRVEVTIEKNGRTEKKTINAPV